MSLNIYKFSDKSGYVVLEQNGKQFKMPIYGESKTNCFLCCLWESEPDAEGYRTYQPQWYCDDEASLKRLLGLTKSYNGEKENYLAEVVKLIVFKNAFPNWKKAIPLFIQAFSNLDIEIREE